MDITAMFAEMDVDFDHTARVLLRSFIDNAPPSGSCWRAQCPSYESHHYQRDPVPKTGKLQKSEEWKEAVKPKIYRRTQQLRRRKADKAFQQQPSSNIAGDEIIKKIASAKAEAAASDMRDNINKKLIVSCDAALKEERNGNGGGDDDDDDSLGLQLSTDELFKRASRLTFGSEVAPSTRGRAEEGKKMERVSLPSKTLPPSSPLVRLERPWTTTCEEPAPSRSFPSSCDAIARRDVNRRIMMLRPSMADALLGGSGGREEEERASHNAAQQRAVAAPAVMTTQVPSESVVAQTVLGNGQTVVTTTLLNGHDDLAARPGATLHPTRNTKVRPGLRSELSHRTAPGSHPLPTSSLFSAESTLVEGTARRSGNATGGRRGDYRDTCTVGFAYNATNTTRRLPSHTMCGQNTSAQSTAAQLRQQVGMVQRIPCGAIQHAKSKSWSSRALQTRIADHPSYLRTSDASVIYAPLVSAKFRPHFW